MLFIELLKTSWQSLRVNPKRSFLTMIGIVIGIAAVITIIALGNGVKAKILKELQATNSGKQTTEINYYPNDSNAASQGFTEDDLTQIKNNFSATLSSVKFKRDTKNINNTVFLGNETRTATLSLVKGGNQHYDIDVGRNIAKSDNVINNQVALLNKQLAIKEYGTEENALDSALTVGDDTYKVVGIFTKPTDDYNVDFLLPQRTYLYSTSAQNGSIIKLTFNKGVKVSAASKKIVSFLKKNGSSRKTGSYEYTDMGSLLSGISKVISSLTYFISAIAGISLFIAGIGVMNMMYISVSERTQEIGIRLAVGASARSIMLQFLLEAIMLTVFGGLLGFLIGWGTAALISLALPFKAIVTVSSFLLAFGVSSLVGIVFGLLPAKQAANKNLIDILR
ncbi:cell division protein FtsX [Liquorilactobacillus sucicola DSM 21376 = JCM 15457]|uniref:ABC superfamily ATP binding cassette transporter, membrane protein n=2 Tax=Liquorilactobacillus sucicola TaxID=519050 RepID=A0A023D019_9LACO|nr:ABC transporter permease [Liquorilactobacillus sucicola]KRN06637.1 ABC superfamily ATP binding cassette transporter, membrane protein [Liquorilactobacillus sucicola DSM 21376 = JCM 15457]GAJ27105.1 cell division protein FtsX [Liquorilactobacillus sucicola DSM 21376 = JCM 15457]